MGDCDAGDPCTEDLCDAESGCVYPFYTAPCGDGNACTEGDIGVDGECLGGAAATCDDDPCTTDQCDAATGCLYTNNTAACADGDACSDGDKCQGGPTGAP